MKEIDKENNINNEQLSEQQNNSSFNIYFYIGISITSLVVLLIISYLVYIYYIKPKLLIN
jgi:uncharacterized membrane protein YukC